MLREGAARPRGRAGAAGNAAGQRYDVSAAEAVQLSRRAAGSWREERRAAWESMHRCRGSRCCCWRLLLLLQKQSEPHRAERGCRQWRGGAGSGARSGA